MPGLEKGEPPAAPATQPAAQPPQQQPPPAPAKLPDQPLPAHPAQSAADQPWYQPLWNTVKQINDGLNNIIPEPQQDAGSRDMAHAFTMGYDEDVAAFPGAMVLYYRQQAAGRPITWDQAFSEVKGHLQDQRHEMEAQAPWRAAAGTVTGMGLNALLTHRLYGTVAEGAPLATRALNYAGNVATGATQGGITSFGLSEGDLQRRLDDARKGAEWGGALTAAFPFVARTIGGIYRSLRPTAQIDRKAGEALEQATQGRPTTFAQPPLRNFPVGAGGASGDPGLAAAERRAATIDNQRAVDIRTGQQRAIVEGATQPQPGVGVAGRAAPQLATGVMTPSQAAGRLQTAFRNAWNVFKTEERRLWSTPNLVNRTLDINGLKQGVHAAGNAMPLRFQRAVANTPGLRDVLDDFFRLPNNATLADINDLRSDILAIGRTAVDPMGRQVANRMADELLRAIERDPNIRGNPAAWADYQTARNFTRNMWQTIGQRPFQGIIRPGADPRTTGRLFAFGPQVTGERIPGGIADIGTALDNIRQQWTALGRTGFDPNVAQAAQRELGQGAVDYIINTMIRPIEESQTGAEAGHLNRLVQWIDRNRGWLVGSRLLQPEQLDLLQAIRDSAEMGTRVANLRGGRGSETAERLMGGPNARIIDVFSSALNKRLWTAAGMGIGALVGHWGEMGIGAILGWEAAHGGQQALYRLYEVPAERLAARLVEAAQNPDIARDLLQRAADARNFSTATKQWLASLGAELGANIQHDIAPPVSPAVQ